MKYGLRSSFFRIFRITAVMLALIGAVMWLRGNLTSLESEQAVVNAEIIQIRTPIGGELEIGNVQPGMLLKKGDTLFTIENLRFGDRESVAQYNGLQNIVESIEGELMGAKQSLELANTMRKQARDLYKRELIARVIMEAEEAKYKMAEKLIAAKTEQLARSRERAQQMEAQMAMQKNSAVTMPTDGLVWSITGKSGEQIDSNKPVMEIINPSRIWVDAFFAERVAPSLKPGLPATIQSLDSRASWRGHVESIRAGVGRMAYDSTVAVPPPEMAKRQIAVRLEPDWDHPFAAAEFFGVGRSVQVTFSKANGQPTIADMIKAKVQSAITQMRGDTATAAR